MSNAEIIPGQKGTVLGPFQKVWAQGVNSNGEIVETSNSSEGDLDKLNVSDDTALTINDDLTGLLYLRVGVGAKVENRN